jgi:hypothetical protein
VKKNGDSEILRCSFCNKDQNDVRKLIAGPTVFICDECVDVCNEVRGPPDARARGSSTARCSGRAWDRALAALRPGSGMDIGSKLPGSRGRRQL